MSKLCRESTCSTRDQYVLCPSFVGKAPVPPVISMSCVPSFVGKAPVPPMISMPYVQVSWGGRPAPPMIMNMHCVQPLWGKTPCPGFVGWDTCTTHDREYALCPGSVGKTPAPPVISKPNNCIQVSWGRRHALPIYNQYT